MFTQRAGQSGLETFGHLVQLAHWRGIKAGKILGHRTYRRGDGHFIVVEDDKKAAAFGTGVVHRLVSHARTDRAIADDSNRITGGHPHVPANGKPECGGD